MQQPAIHEPRPGDQLGDFRILSLIGQGAMGKVYEARQLSLQRRVALKVLPADGSGSEQAEKAVTRFYREARAAAQLQHPSIVPVIDFGFEQGHYYYAMAYVAGQSLQAKIHEERVRDMQRIAAWILNVARACEVAHQQGVIHRDIKPANVMIRAEDDEALITDFGLARQQRTKSITQVGALLGTPVYMAPEQARGERATAAVDIYALGATLYEALAGQVPFMAPGLRELLVLITQSPPTPPRQHKPDVPEDLQAIALRAMAKSPAERYPSARAMAEDLLRFLRNEPVEANTGKGGAQRFFRRLEKQPLLAALALLQSVTVIALLILSAWLPRRAQVSRAEASLAAVREAVGDRLAAWSEARAALAAAQEERDGSMRLRGDQAPPGDAAVTRARLALREVERDLLAGADQGAPAERALRAARQAWAQAPAEHPLRAEAHEAMFELLRLTQEAAERRGERGLAQECQRELVSLRESASARGLRVESEPRGAIARLRPVVSAEGRWTLGPVEELGPTPVEAGGALEVGRAYLLELELAGRVSLRLPFVAPAGEGALVRRLALPDAQGIPAGLVYVPPGPFRSGGDPEAVRPLFRAPTSLWVHGFFLGAREVSVADYRRFLLDRPVQARPALLPRSAQLILAGDAVQVARGQEQHPAVGVSYPSALAYCRWLSERTPGLTFRLPTDLEWEKAALALPGNSFPWGERFDLGADPPLANLHRYGSPPPRAPTAPGGSFSADHSLYGVFDMGGNVCEWVDGAFGGDPRFRVLRGGSWSRGPEPSRSTSREAVDAAGFPQVAPRVGFRVACD
ncbi:MAG TPA: hypothetical protein DEA08_03800 [Planctomycetes bacterium]|nr:hypothetical protein [Planctomycetota bacterium]